MITGYPGLLPSPGSSSAILAEERQVMLMISWWFVPQHFLTVGLSACPWWRSKVSEAPQDVTTLVS